MSTNSPIPEGAAKHSESESFHASMLAASLTVKDLVKSLAW